MPKEFSRKRGGRRGAEKKEKSTEEVQKVEDSETPVDFNADFLSLDRSEPGPSSLPPQRSQFEQSAAAEGLTDPNAPFGYVDPDIKAYFRTVDEKLKEWEAIGLIPGEDAESELEDRTTFLHSTLAEVRGLELKLATDPDCALVTERLLHSMGDWGRRVLTDSFSGQWTTLLQHRFGSHVCQGLFALGAETIDREARNVFPKQQLEQERNSGKSSSAGVLRTMTELVKDLLEEIRKPLPSLLVSPFASPPIRLLFLVLSPGRIISPSAATADDRDGKRIRSKKSAKFRSHHQAGEMKSILGNTEEEAAATKERKVPDGLKTLRKEIREDLMGRMSGVEWRAMGVEKVGGPAIQLLLEFEGEEEACLVPDSILDHLTGGLVTHHIDSRDSAELPTGDYVPSLLRDDTGSHLLQTVLRVAPQPIFDVVWQSYFVSKVGKLAVHPIGNYVIGTAMERLSDQQLQETMGELRTAGPGSFIRTSRTSVLQSLSHRALQSPNLQPAVVDLCISACEIPDGQERDLILPCLLTLNVAKAYEKATRVTNGEQAEEERHEVEPQQHGWKPRQPKKERQPLEPTMQGSLLLQGLLKLSSPASDRIAESLLSRSIDDLLTLAHHPISSHVLEALVKSPAIAPKYKRQMMNVFIGRYLDLVNDRFGSRVGESIWEKADGFMKEKIARSLLHQAIPLGNSQYGRFLANRLNLHILQRRPDEWRKMIAAPASSSKHAPVSVPSAKASAHGPMTKEPDTAISPTVSEAQVTIDGEVSKKRKRERNAEATNTDLDTLFEAAEEKEKKHKQDKKTKKDKEARKEKKRKEDLS